MAKIEQIDIWTNSHKAGLISIMFVETNKKIESGKLPKDIFNDDETSKAYIDAIQSILNK